MQDAWSAPVPPFDAIVVGVGGMGSAALFHLARRGARVLGLERFGVAHAFGSSHGHTRIIRLAYWEDRAYVPLLRRAYELWRELEAQAGERLLLTTGSIDAAPRDSRVIRGVLDACSAFALPHAIFDGRTLRARYPAYELPADAVAIYQPDGGILFPERCITQHVAAAARFGAIVHTGERVLEWTIAGGHARVRTDRGEYSAPRLIVTAGAWTGQLVPPLARALAPERQVVLWTKPARAEWFEPENFPVFYIHVDEGSFYGFPSVDGHGFKIGKYHHLGERIDPDRMDREPHPRDEGVLRAAIRKYFPAADGPTLQMTTCLFTNTADEHFVIDRLHDRPPVVVGAGFSGHGYKFCSVIGEVLADLALDGGTRHDIGLFAAGRFGTASA